MTAKLVEAEPHVDVLPNGQLLVRGILKIKLKNGAEEVKEKTTAFCRCDASGNKPYCDGPHSKCGFKDE